jgi:hypothetical protein
VFLVPYGRHQIGVRSASYSQALRDIAKETPGMAWRPEDRIWAGYPDAVEVVVSRLKVESTIDVSDPRSLLVNPNSNPPVPV